MGEGVKADVSNFAEQCGRRQGVLYCLSPFQLL